MKKLYIFVLFSIFLVSKIQITTHAQDFPDKTVDWHFDIDKKDEIYTLKINAELLEPDWHFWTIDLKSEFLIPTKIILNDSASYEFIQNLQVKGDKVQLDDEIFGNIEYYKSDTEFTQNFKLKNSQRHEISGSVTFQSCNNNMCKPPEIIKFSIPLP